MSNRALLGIALAVVGAMGTGFALDRCLVVRADDKSNSDQPKRTKDDDGPPVALQKIEEPKDGALYVWPVPVTGHQSLITLGVVDGNVIDAAYLVPVRIRLRGVTAPALDAKGGKESQAALEKLLMGQLRTAQLWGGDSKGILADFWIPAAKEGEKGSWASDLMVKQKMAEVNK